MTGFPPIFWRVVELFTVFGVIELGRDQSVVAALVKLSLASRSLLASKHPFAFFASPFRRSFGPQTHVWYALGLTEIACKSCSPACPFLLRSPRWVFLTCSFNSLPRRRSVSLEAGYTIVRPQFLVLFWFKNLELWNLCLLTCCCRCNFCICGRGYCSYAASFWQVLDPSHAFVRLVWWIVRTLVVNKSELNIC